MKTCRSIQIAAVTFLVGAWLAASAHGEDLYNKKWSNNDFCSPEGKAQSTPEFFNKHCPNGIRNYTTTATPTSNPYKTPSGGYSGGSRITPGDINAIGNAIVNILDSSNAAAEAEERRQQQREQAAEQRKKQQIQTQTNQLLNAAASDLSLNPWAAPPKPEKSDEAPPKLNNCDCTRIVGTCYGSISATPIAPSGTRATYGAELSIRSNESRCARVSYYVDSTPYFNVLSQGNSTTDSVWGQRPITKNSISNVECHVCSSTGQ